MLCIKILQSLLIFWILRPTKISRGLKIILLNPEFKMHNFIPKHWFIWNLFWWQAGCVPPAWILFLQRIQVTCWETSHEEKASGSAKLQSGWSWCYFAWMIFNASSLINSHLSYGVLNRSIYLAPYAYHLRRGTVVLHAETQPPCTLLWTFATSHFLKKAYIHKFIEDEYIMFAYLFILDTLLWMVFYGNVWKIFQSGILEGEN